MSNFPVRDMATGHAASGVGLICSLPIARIGSCRYHGNERTTPIPARFLDGLLPSLLPYYNRQISPIHYR